MNAGTRNSCLWAAAAVSAAAASFAAGMLYGIPIVSIETHYDLDRLTHRMADAMRESGVHLTSANYVILASADLGAGALVFFPNNLDEGMSWGHSWSNASKAVTKEYSNGTRFWQRTDHDGNVLKEFTFHDDRDKLIMVIVMDHKTGYLSDEEQKRITREFFPETLCDVDCTRLSEPKIPEGVLFPP